MAGAFIATGFLLDPHVINSLPADWDSFGSTIANFIGSLTIAWFFGHMLGMTEGDYLKKDPYYRQRESECGFPACLYLRHRL